MRSAPLIVLVCLGLLLGVQAIAQAEDRPLPTPVLDAPDVQVHKFEQACNTYVLTCKQTKEYVIVDPGNGFAELVAARAKTGHALKAIWITHEHGDHFVGLGPLAQAHPVPILAHAATTKSMEAQVPKLPALPDTEVAGGGTVKVGELTWRVLYLPGHSRGSVGFLLAGRVFVGGDVLFKGSIGRTDLSTSDAETFQKSLGSLWDLPDASLVLPGHGETTTIGAEKKTNWLFQDFVRAGRGEDPIARPWMGIRIDPDYVGRGIGLASVEKGSPAEKAGLKAGDAILKADGVALSAGEDLLGVIRRRGVGDTIQLLIRRGSETKPIPFTFGARPPK